MAPSSTTPNFSRPLPSPMLPGGVGTPGRGAKDRHALRELPNSVFLANTSMPQVVQAGRAKEAAPASQRLFDIATDGVVPDKQAHSNKLNTTNDASTDGTYEIVQQHNNNNRSRRRLSKVSVKSAAESSISDLSIDLGGPDKPISNFRPNLWRHLDRDREVLNIDLFWPVKLDDEEDSDEDEDEGKATNDDGDSKDVFPFKELKPLTEFYNLHHLKLNGMMRSYQPLIWATCWVNKRLTKVHLEMALEPVINADIMHKYRKIDLNWVYDRLSDTTVECEYLGSHGEGILHEEFGEGEYLDQQAMKAGQINVVHVLPVENFRYLPITHLTLMNFAVDAGPFFRWFDPAKLKEVQFLGDCIDTGFSLPREMKFTVRVNGPKPLPLPPAGARWVRPGEVKLVDIKPRKTAASNNKAKTNKATADDRGSATTNSEFTIEGSHSVACGGSTGLKGKLSQMMPKWASKSKDKSSSEQDQPVYTIERSFSGMSLSD
ncbi:hypothetical protein HRR83_009250 [Exophiala dermatitidis]|uniref:Uncharacterized protein n=1 Tax=Exophiala dermatitidis (strain ATCC 34100 / CBS 525.76 / NIH/UT8656) TaxID=858893 RepID=H6BNZ8_EXODN|nr:uncharacterized protein HMPREF1120_00628 [Exophiala dermatitidis NIH/UT8656]XP_009152877.1 hypothetical protein, variant [Exophiala dermatitidis NIH/UT8656]KAJ4502069.1 hypothetical protein HRR75_008657 [Exophiala dermatitidis]EHY52415.1 hypothetical protein, variant [Exophiala dermatitidis NIH/UT8656]EHY52416.1 hypothetical protein HMPREF1120_00628 [Exophiala dermatitidis NIH/UT8656]KAJ4502537.1 hypothetical protein HRR73_009405 [Exophiala dermatitidis]KAJ4503024.1 hypothetical protein HR